MYNFALVVVSLPKIRMTDYKYLKENKLFEAHMKFMKAIGESYGYSPIEEEDDDQNQQQGPMMGGGTPGQDSNQMGADPMVGGMPSQDGMNGESPNGQEGDMPPMMGAEGGMDANAPMPGADPIGGEMPGAEDIPGMDSDMGENEDDDVINVEDLTKAQEKLNDKENSLGKDLGKVDRRIEKLIGAIDKLQGMFDRNNQEIADLRNEFEKRNPTQTEKLNLRSLDSYPFKVKLTDYWQGKEGSNYSAYSDNEEPTTHEYTITNNDVDDFNEREVADSFYIDDDLNQDIKKIFGL